MVAQAAASTSGGSASAGAAKAKRKKDRSPPYPSIAFADALDKAKLIWDRDKKHPISADLVAQCLGYKNANNGAFLPLLSALKKYGTVVSAGGDDLRVSDDAAAIFILPESSPERQKLMKKLAMMPPIFAKVIAKYGADLPSDQTLRAKLRLDFRFASDDAADSMIRSLRASLAIAGVDRPGTAEQDDEALNGAEEPALPTPPPTSPAVLPMSAPLPKKPLGEHVEHRRWVLSDGAVATVSITGELTPKGVARLKRYIDAFAAEAAIAWEDKEEGNSGGST